MAISIDQIRLCHKRSNTAGVEPTIPTVADHNTPGWLPTDLYDGELFMNTADHKIWYRTGSTITLIQGNASMVLSDLLDVNYTGSPGEYPNDGDILQWNNDSLSWVNVTGAGVLGVSGYSGYSGAAGTSGYSGYMGIDGANSRRWYYGEKTVNGEFQLNSPEATFATVTDFFINVSDWVSSDQRAWHQAAYTWENSNPTRLLLQVTESNNVNNFGIYYISSVKDHTTNWQWEVSSVISANGTVTPGHLYTVSWVLLGSSGISGYSGADGASGISGYSGTNGSDGVSGYSGYSGADGASGISGYSGAGGASGFSGFSGAGGAAVGSDMNVMFISGTAQSGTSEFTYDYVNQHLNVGSNAIITGESGYRSLTVGSTVLGKSGMGTNGNGNYCLAVGDDAKAYDRGWAGGTCEAAQWCFSHGNLSYARGSQSFSMGDRNSVNSNYGSAIGSLNNITGNASAGIGSSNTVSSNNSFAAGESNTVNGNQAVAFGFSNNVGGVQCCGGFGYGNTVEGYRQFAFGYGNHCTTGPEGHAGDSIALGANNHTSGDAASIAIGNYATAYMMGHLAHAAPRSLVSGMLMGQYSHINVTAKTTNDTATELWLQHNSHDHRDYLILPDDTVWKGKALVVAMDSAGNVCEWDCAFMIKNINGTTALVGTPTVTKGSDEITIGGLAITADDTNNALVFTGTGKADTTIYWNACIEWAEIRITIA